MKVLTHDCFTFSTDSSVTQQSVKTCMYVVQNRAKHLITSIFISAGFITNHETRYDSFLKMLLFVTKQLRIWHISSSCHCITVEKNKPKHLFSYRLLKYRDFSTSEQYDWNKSVQLNIKSVCGGKHQVNRNAGIFHRATGMQRNQETL